jgi:hypothetical protein
MFGLSGYLTFKIVKMLLIWVGCFVVGFVRQWRQGR